MPKYPVIITNSRHGYMNSQYILDGRTQGIQRQTGRDGEEKTRASAQNRTPVVQPLACHFADGAIA
jgi:hypothetical protein